MSGTEEQNFGAQAGSEGGNQSGTDTAGTNSTTNQSGIDYGAKIAALEAELADVRKEAASYRNKAKGKETVEEQLKALQDEFAKTKRENRLVKNQSLLDKAGCIKSDLVATVIPDDCDNVQEWIDNYKKDNEVLFKTATTNHGGNFKPSNGNNTNPHEAMNEFIRARSGR
jgi:hypothetical protein